MRTREQIKGEQEFIKRQISTLEDHLLELNREDVLLSDDKQWFEEKTETIKFKSGRKVTERQHLIGRVYWDEYFDDEDKPGHGVTVTRTRIVRIDGEWKSYFDH